MSNERSAVVQMPTMGQLGKATSPPLPGRVRVPYFPTAPYIPTNPYVGIQSRIYGATLVPADIDYTVNSEAIRIVQFDIPCVLIARNGGAFNTATAGGTAGNVLPLGVRPLDTFLFRMEYSTGDKFDTGPRIASTCLGEMQNPGELGGVGYVIQPGASVVLGITPLLAGLRIDIGLVCQEIRGPSNYTIGTGG